MSQARRSYEDNHRLMGVLLARLVAQHKELKANAEPNWGHVGDLDHINEHLMSTMNLSPADVTELGIDFS